VYDFMLFLWSRISGGDSSVTWQNTHPAMFVFGGSASGVGSAAYYASEPTPPAGFEYGFWSPFSLQPTSTGFGIVDDNTVSAWEPAISIANISANADVWYPCSYPTYCPYHLP
jgi:hypothetical protein